MVSWLGIQSWGLRLEKKLWLGFLFKASFFVFLRGFVLGGYGVFISVVGVGDCG